MATKKDIYQTFVVEYRNATKDRKTKIIDAIVETTSVTRKSVIRHMRYVLLYGDAKPLQRRGRKATYGIDVTAALKTLWECGGQVSGVILYPSIREYVEILQRDHDWKHGTQATAQVLTMSEATVRRRVSAFRKKENIKGASCTTPSKIKTIVPVYAGSWRMQRPGAGQIDTVVHCGQVLMGDMAYTLTFVSVVIGWVVLRAQWNKGELATTEAVQFVEDTLPWPIEWIHSDSGGEFIQWDLVTWTKERKIRFTRCRRGKKNDNAYVEERNGHVVRKWVGDERYDCPESVVALNAYYETLMIFVNHFIAIRKTVSKTRSGGRTIRVRDIPQTPYARALAHPDISEEVKKILREEHDALNPLRLTQKLATLKSTLFVIQKRHGNPKFRV